jgi:hypothetical protein
MRLPDSADEFWKLDKFTIVNEYVLNVKLV